MIIHCGRGNSSLRFQRYFKNLIGTFLAESVNPQQLAPNALGASVINEEEDPHSAASTADDRKPAIPMARLTRCTIKKSQKAVIAKQHGHVQPPLGPPCCCRQAAIALGRLTRCTTKNSKRGHHETTQPLSLAATIRRPPCQLQSINMQPTKRLRHKTTEQH